MSHRQQGKRAAFYARQRSSRAIVADNRLFAEQMRRYEAMKSSFDPQIRAMAEEYYDSISGRVRRAPPSPEYVDCTGLGDSLQRRVRIR